MRPPTRWLAIAALMGAACSAKWVRGDGSPTDAEQRSRDEFECAQEARDTAGRQRLGPASGRGAMPPAGDGRRRGLTLERMKRTSQCMRERGYVESDER